MAPSGYTPAVNCSILFTDLPLLERPAAAKAAGFGAVEFWWPFAEAVPADADVDAFVGAVQDAGVQLIGLNLFAGDMPGGDRGLVSWVGREAEFADNLPVVAGIAERLGCRAFNALYGNRIDGLAPEKQDELALAHLELAARELGRIGGTVLLEPVSGMDAYPIKTAADAVAVLDRLDPAAGEVKLLVDFYHLAVNGDDVPTVIDAHIGRAGHVQIADSPGRGEPGTGDLPLTEWLDHLVAAGYRGHVALEHKAVGDDPFAWLPREYRAA
ncbi:TIM barrel protein [Pseudonocardia nematodicida]|uniref:TIM barrel protein n=1 Tax=Pseudonocardia nematodicida TaxID=1206997 RepID=A0ABV1KJK8_9PSEU